LDIYLTPIGGGAPITASQTSEDNLEHIFFEVENPGNYKIQVVHQGVGPTSSQNYALAWWAGSASSSQSGDFDNDGDVDGRDFLVWQRGESPDPLSAGDLSDWQTNYGFGTLSAAAAVPEPSCSALLLLALVGWPRLGTRILTI
jgi:hypothetical protein